MTVQELRDKLAAYPDGARVYSFLLESESASGSGTVKSGGLIIDQSGAIVREPGHDRIIDRYLGTILLYG